MKQQWLVLRPPRLPFSFHLDARVPKILLGLTIATLIAMVLSVSQGEYFVPPLDAIKTILGIEASNTDYDFIVITLRLPRTLDAWGVGIGLAIAGTITQGVTRNPLAAPDIIGFNAGASFAAVTLIVLYPELPTALIPLAAFGGALATALLIYLLAWRGGSSPVRLILVGVGLSLIAGALTNLMVTLGNIYNVSQALVWLAGSVYARSWEQLAVFAPWLVIFGLLTLLMNRELNALQLGDDIARSLGSRLELQRGLLLFSSVALVGSSVAIAGSIGFVGLMAPHLGRQMVGPSHEGLLLVAALTGGLVVIVADLAGRLLFAPIELPCGIVTAIVGAPYFLYLLIRDRQP
jgi:iron complex transport system permease protein